MNIVRGGLIWHRGIGGWRTTKAPGVRVEKLPEGFYRYRLMENGVVVYRGVTFADVAQQWVSDHCPCDHEEHTSECADLIECGGGDAMSRKENHGRRHILGDGRTVEIRRDDYKWDKCYGVFDVGTGVRLYRDVRMSLCYVWLREQREKNGIVPRRQSGSATTSSNAEAQETR